MAPFHRRLLLRNVQEYGPRSLTGDFILVFWLTLPLPPGARRNGKIFDRRPGGI